MTTISFVEKPKLTQTIYVSQLSMDEFKPFLRPNTSAKDAKNLFTLTKKYTHNVIDNKGSITVPYGYPNGTIQHFGNRLFAKGGIQNLPCTIRNFLFSGIATDIDVQNCHPVLLQYICKTYQFETPHLSNYIKNRNYVLSLISNDKDEAKRKILASMNDQSIKAKKNDSQIFKELDSEFKRIQDKLFSISDFESLKTTISSDKIDNMKGCFLNRILCAYENELIQKVAVYLQSKNIELVGLFFDGCLVYGTNYDDSLLEELKTVANDTFPDSGITFSFKPLETPIVLPDDFNPNTNKSKIDWTNLTDATFASTFSELFFKDKLVFTGMDKDLDGYYFNGVFWKKLGINNAEISKGYFNELYNHYKSELDSCSWLEEKDYNKYLTKIQYIGSSVGRKHIIDILQKEHYQSDIIWNNHPNLFAFDDCIYDLETQTQIEPKPEFYINITTGYSIGNLDLISKETKDEIKTTIQGLFDDEATYKYVMKVMASFLKQGNQEEKCYFWLGKGRNGKGTLSTLLNSSFGNYFGNLNLGYYTDYSKRDDAPNPNLVNLRYARIINTSEIGEDAIDPDKPIRFRTDKFKSITGNDDIEARNLFKNQIIKYKAGKTIIQTNLMPIFIGIEDENNFSLRERIVIIPFPHVFVDKSQLDKSKPFLKEKNNNLKEKLNNVDYRNAFIAILLETYSEYLKDGLIEPPRVKQEKMKFFNESNKFQEWFHNSVIKSEMNVKTMSIDELLISYQNIVPKITKSKMIKDLEQIVGKQSNTNDRTGLKTSRGVYSLVGYEWKPESNEIDDDTDEETSD